ncbi:AAR173Cp [Eremothecium gossypii ATCC 10895]|uniref:Glucosidase II subunit alpha n=1 Tax=Eremothecium gossypii (strain ATCC 10895 / CBS 109.51 / FGSC 9923 / NRRL Y-1056) TaxID=284811 RepID=Q75EA4_EREGS|nr:AAR173Cp [Eremothecium gossypii ATCC 10895]AAS50540.1 AAR173Cp [Eremothecium gossypii ATCC 10895]
MHWNRILFWGCALLLQQLADAFDEGVLRKCNESGVCHRNRHYGEKIASSGAVYYTVDWDSLELFTSGHTVQGKITKRLPRGKDKGSIALPFTLDVLENSLVRLRIDEDRDVTGLPEILSPRRYNGTSDWMFEDGVVLRASACNQSTAIVGDGKKMVIENSDDEVKVELFQNPFKLDVYHHDKLLVTINDRSFLNLEHWRLPRTNYQNSLPEESDYDSFYDNFHGAGNDTLPFGPESVALDVTLHGFKNVYGIPEHADSLKLRDTSGGEPYRLFNADCFEYPVKSTSPMYGSIPLMVSHAPHSSVGLFWVNSADTWIDVNYSENNVKTHWMSEAGVLDIIILLQESPAKVTESYTNITGKPAFPPISALGYHQCRWNYNDEQDLMTVNNEMDKAEMPLDFLWLDIEYTDEKKYFTWKKDAFPDPLGLFQKLANITRNLVTIIDPHLKLNYNLTDIMVANDGAIKNSTGQPFIGECWPGTSIWIDTFSPVAKNLWASFYHNFVEGAKNLFIWNDMNEMAVFDGIESTAPRDAIVHGGFEHRAVHNLYGMTVHQASYQGLRERYAEDNKRPFLLTRSYSAGSQRTAAGWSGDAVGTWDYLKITIPIILANNIVGMPFFGGDVPGFTGDPDPVLTVRWYQAGMWFPLFRGHGHKDTKRREPYLLEEPYKSIVRDVLRARYALLPTLYTAFHESNATGVPIINPMFYEKPDLEEAFDIDDQFYLGRSGLLVKPVVNNSTTTTVFFPPGRYYDYFTLETFAITDAKRLTIDTPLSKIPAYLESGKLIVTRDRYRRTTKLMERDPYTLVVAPDDENKAYGVQYIDDGATFAYQDGRYVKVEYSYFESGMSAKILKTTDELKDLMIEKIVIAKHPSFKLPGICVFKQEQATWTARITEDENKYTIHNSGVKVGVEWSIKF